MSTRPVSADKTNIRWLVLLMLFIVTTYNFIDRSTISVAAGAIKKDLHISAISMGLALSAFGWSYTALQLPGGWLIDKFGSRIVYTAGLALWSIFTIVTGFAAGMAAGSAFMFIFILRMLVGVAEAPAFPANSRVTSMWFPNHERGFASSLFNSAQYLALAIGTPIMSWILVTFGWKHIFFYVGALGIILSIFLYKIILEPKKHPRINQAELNYIQAGGGLATVSDKGSEIKWDYVKKLLSNRMMLGIYIGQFCINTITWFFLTWFPTYLTTAKHMSILKVGIMASIPAIGGFVGNVLGGYLSDLMLRKGVSLTVARKMPIIVGLLLSTVIIGCNYTNNTTIVITLMSVAFFAKGFGALGWTLVSDTSPKEIMGLSGGMFNFFGNIASIVTPIVIGYILQVTGSFNGALVFVGTVGFIGAMSFLFIVPEIKRLVVKPEESKVAA